jgi:cellobiose-specific phosphotransferase system component IIB
MSERTPESSPEHNEESLSKKARETGLTLKELVNSIGKKSKAAAQQKSTQLKEAAKDDEINAKDAADIQMLGSHIESIITIFEDTMDKITQHTSYDEQHGMLVGFKKVLEEEVNLINARLNMAKRLKRLEPSQKSETLEERIEERKRTNAIDAELISPPLSEKDEANTMAEMVDEDKDKNLA